MERKKVRYICNPISGTGFNPYIEHSIYLRTDRNLFEVDFILTQYKGHAFELAKEAAEQGFYACVAIGGDGTVHEVAQGLVNSKTALGIIPSGSGNGLALHLKLPKSELKQIDLIYQSEPIPIDSVSFNEEVFFNVAGLGFEAEVAHHFAKSRQRGWFNYLRNIVKCWRSSKCFKATLTVNGEPIERELWQITIANGSQYGNNMKISPESKLDDGQFEILLMEKPSGLKVIQLILKSFFEIQLNKNLIEKYCCSEANIAVNSTFAHVDGEPLTGFDGNLSLKCRHHSLLILSNND